MTDRLEHFLGRMAPWFLHPLRAALFCALGWLVLLPLCWQHPLMTALAWSSFWALLMALKLEAPILQGLPLPPLTVLLLGMSMRWGLGPLLMALGGHGSDSFLSIWLSYGSHAQLLWLVFTFILLIGGLFHRSSISRASASLPSGLWLKVFQDPKHDRLRRQLAGLAAVLTVYMGFYLLLSLLSGAFDRQFDIYTSWAHRLWRLDTPVAAFSRLRDLWLLLFPLWWRVLQPRWRWLLTSLLLLYIASALLSGSRGLLFYPAVLLLSGSWFVISKLNQLRRLALALAAVLIVMSPVIYLTRESVLFQRAPNWQTRAAAVVETLLTPDPLFEKLRWLGRDLYACHDPYLFTPENRSLQPVGSAGLENLIYLWLPRHVMPTRPVLFDGHLIAKHLQRIQSSAWSDVWFPCFSLPADLFRRWQWTGVVFGSLVLSGVIQICLGFWYRHVSLPGTSFQLFLLVYPASYLQSFPFGTVSETCWALFWELPKYLLLFWVLGQLVDRSVDRCRSLSQDL